MTESSPATKILEREETAISLEMIYFFVRRENAALALVSFRFVSAKHFCLLIVYNCLLKRTIFIPLVESSLQPNMAMAWQRRLVILSFFCLL